MDHNRQYYNDPWDSGVYGTGNTMPPKSHGGLIALLLILVIFLSGIVTFLSFLNIKLVWQLNHQANQTEYVPISFSNVPETQGQSVQESNATLGSEPGYDLGSNSLGLAGQAISRFDQNYFSLPQGLYLTQVSYFSDAHSQGLRAGDILLSVDGTPVTTQEELNALLAPLSPGDTVSAEIYRDGERFTVNLTLSDRDE